MPINSKIKLWKIFLALSLVAVLVISMAVPALAKSGEKPSNVTAADTINILKGKITAVDAVAATFKVQPASGDAVTIKTDTNTRFYLITADLNTLPAIKEQVKDRVNKMMKDRGNNRDNQRGLGNKNVQTAAGDTVIVDEENDPEELPEMEAGLDSNIEVNQGFFSKFKSIFNRGPKFGKTAAFTDLKVGDGVVMHIMPNENLAKQVLIVKASNLKTVKGNIIAVTADSFTITAADNTTVTLKWNANTHVAIRGAISIKIGQYAQAVYNGETLVAKTINVQLEAPPTPTPTPSVTTTT